MRILGNIIWHIPFMGFIFSLFYFILGALCCITVILMPIGLGLFQFARFLLAPFSRQLVPAKDLKHIGKYNKSSAGESFDLIIKILYFPFGLLSSIVTVFVIVAECATIIGIPFGIIWAKSLRTIFSPVGMVCVSREEALAIEQKKIQDMLKCD